MIVNGKAIAEAVYTRLLSADTRPSLGILIAGSDAVTDSFVRTKARAAEHLGVEVIRISIPESATTDEALEALAQLTHQCDGLIVQLPLPKNIDTEKILAAISPEKDVDGISASPKVRPPVAEAIAEIFTAHAIDPKGKNAVVVGSGRLVGAPAAMMLNEMGATVTTLNHGDSLDPLVRADIVILGAGEPGLVKPEHLKNGVVLIDAGTSEAGGKIAGDADPACADSALVFTPVPGGVGPVAVAMIFKNLFKLAQESR